MKKLYAGIDPGTKGAIVIIDSQSNLVDWLSFPKITIEWECGVTLIDEDVFLSFINVHRDSLNCVAIEVLNPSRNFNNSLKSLTDLRGKVAQLHALSHGIPRRFVLPQQWLKANNIPPVPKDLAPKVRSKKRKDINKEWFLSREEDPTDYAYQLEGVVDAYAIARWVLIQCQLDALDDVYESDDLLVCRDPAMLF